MKILIVTETLYEGGAELFVLRLARKFRQMNIGADVLCLNAIHENKELTAAYSEIPVLRLNIPFQKLIERIDRKLLQLGIDYSIRYSLQARAVRKKYIGRYDVIHTNYIQVDHLFAKLKQKTKKFRQVVTVHGDYSAHWRNEELKKGRAWLNLKAKLEVLKQNADKWVVVSEEQKKFFFVKMNLSANKLAKIYNGFEPLSAAVESEKGKALTIGMVSRGEAQKGWQILINAFLRMPGDCRLMLVGDSEYLRELKKKYEAHLNIIFTGFHSNPVELMEQFHVFVLPTLYPFESLPTVIIEALYCGAPVIATNVGEIEAMITDEATGEKAGMLLHMQDGKISEEQLYQFLARCYDDRQMLEQMGNLAKKMFQKFDMQKCADAYLEIYRRVLEK
jgi:glycosyltransferase involved in cell wall biosynthesis